jgi:hypothetical protein
MSYTPFKMKGASLYRSPMKEDTDNTDDTDDSGDDKNTKAPKGKTASVKVAPTEVATSKKDLSMKSAL